MVLKLRTEFLEFLEKFWSPFGQSVTVYGLFGGVCFIIYEINCVVCMRPKMTMDFGFTK